MECSSEVVVFACAYKMGVAGPNEIQNGGQIQTKRNFLHYKPAYKFRGVGKGGQLPPPHFLRRGGIAPHFFARDDNFLSTAMPLHT